MKTTFASFALISALLCAACAGPETERKLSDTHSMDYLKAREDSELVYPEGVEPPERSPTYDIPPLSPEADREYDVDELARPPLLIGRDTSTADKSGAIKDIPGPPEEDMPAVYAGIGIGSVDFEDRYGSIPYDDKPVSLQLYTGYRLNSYLAAELAYIRLNDIDPGEVPGSGFDLLKISSKYDAFAVRARGSVPLGWLFDRLSDFSVFGTIGYYDAKIHRNVTDLDSHETASVSGSDSGRVFGGGILYRLGGMKLRVYAESFEVKDVKKIYDKGIMAEFTF